MRRLLPLILVAMLPAGTVAGRKKADRARTDDRTQLELNITLVQPISTFSGEVKVAAFDPNFVLIGTVSWIQRPDFLPIGSEQAFAIHSKAEFLLDDYMPGDARCYELTRDVREDGKTSWSLWPAVGERACKRDGEGGAKTGKKKKGR